MTDRKYTIVGSFTQPQVGDASLLFVHVEAAQSVQDAQDQLQAVFPHDAVYATFAGHLQPLDGGHALQLLSGGQLLEPGTSPTAEAAPSRRARP